MCTRHILVSCISVAALLAACGDDENIPARPDAGTQADAAPTPDADPGAPPTTYTFDSRFVAGESAVAYSGQTFRHTLIAELTSYVEALTAAVGTTPPADGDVAAALGLYMDFDGSTAGELALTITTDPPLLQTTYNDISSGADLRSKLAGNDAVTDHKAWNTPGTFLGWSEGGEAADTPTELVEYWFGVLDDLAYQRGMGNPALDPDNNPIGVVYVTAAGQDLKQLLQKFLLGAVTLQQGLDDYLHDDVDGKGLLASNVPEDGAAYSALEHQWDEGFGYFGAARDYGDYTDDDIAGADSARDGWAGYHDTDGDDKIDLGSEYNFGASVNCAKRDRGSADSAKTDYTRAAFDAFIAGRHLIWSTDGELDTAALDELKGYRDTIAATWERCIAATVVHYINDTLADMAKIDAGGYVFLDHAKHWSEMKGFALGLQFAPNSPLHEGTRFADLHGYLGDAPVLPGAGAQALADYAADLEAARALMQEAYGFDAANVEGW